MAQHGVDDPEALPQNLRTKPHQFKRKDSEPSSQRPQPLQPAPGRSDSGTPTSNSFPQSAGINHHNQPGPILSGLHDGSNHAHPAHWGVQEDRHGPFSMSVSPRDGTREAFAPHAFMHSGGMQSPGFGGPVSPRQTGGMFNERSFGGIDSVAVLGSVDSPMRDSFGGGSQSLGGQAGSQDVAQMFNDLTNQGEEDEHAKGGKIERGERERDTKWDDDDMGLLFDGP